jgi:hypothetical protein
MLALSRRQEFGFNPHTVLLPEKEAISVIEEQVVWAEVTALTP